MAKLEITELVEILREGAGEAEGVDLDGSVLDVSFLDLGYDSIAMLETASLVQRRCGVVLSDDAVAEADTPRRFLALVNGAPAVSA